MRYCNLINWKVSLWVWSIHLKDIDIVMPTWTTSCNPESRIHIVPSRIQQNKTSEPKWSRVRVCLQCSSSRNELDCNQPYHWLGKESIRVLADHKQKIFSIFISAIVVTHTMRKSHKEICCTWVLRKHNHLSSRNSRCQFSRIWQQKQKSSRIGLFYLTSEEYFILVNIYGCDSNMCSVPGNDEVQQDVPISLQARTYAIRAQAVLDLAE